MQIDSGAGVRKNAGGSFKKNGFKKGKYSKKSAKKYYSKMLKTTWDGVVYKKIHVLQDMLNVEGTGYLGMISWGSLGSTTTNPNRIFLSDQPEFTKYIELFDAYKIMGFKMEVQSVGPILAAGVGGTFSTAYIEPTQVFSDTAANSPLVVPNTITAVKELDYKTYQSNLPIKRFYNTSKFF